MSLLVGCCDGDVNAVWAAEVTAKLAPRAKTRIVLAARRNIEISVDPKYNRGFRFSREGRSSVDRKAGSCTRPTTSFGVASILTLTLRSWVQQSLLCDSGHGTICRDQVEQLRFATHPSLDPKGRIGTAFFFY